MESEKDEIHEFLKERDELNADLGDNSVESLQKSLDSGNITAEQIFATLVAAEYLEEILSVLQIMCKLVADEGADYDIKSKVIKHIPSVVKICVEPTIPIPSVISDMYVPSVMKMLIDKQLQIRTMGHSALIELVKNKMIKPELLEHICSSISRLVLTESSLPEEIQLEDVSVLCKMIQYVDKEIVVKYFLDSFLPLCCHSSYIIRKMCVAKIHVLSQKCAGTDVDKSILVLAFEKLCSDEKWCIRAICADIFVDFARTVELCLRRSILSDIFIRLLNDAVNHVAIRTSQSLGLFISTLSENQNSEECSSATLKEISVIVRNGQHFPSKYYLNFNEESRCCPTASVLCSPECCYRQEVCEDKFNSFQFWRMPLPMVEFFGEDIVDVENNGCLLVDVREDRKLSKPELRHFEFQSPSKTCFYSFPSVLKTELAAGKVYVEEMDPVVYEQEIIPPKLLRQFLSLIPDPATSFSDGQNTERQEEIFLNCACSFPAVASTLGRQHWKCVKNSFHNLAGNIKWNVRKVVASSLLELTEILEHDAVVKDLLPVFLALAQDIDEVRLTVLQNLPDFLLYLEPSERKEFLRVLNTVSKVNDEKNWRLRLVIVEKLGFLINLFSPVEVHDYVLPVALSFLKDKVCDVRKSSVELLAKGINYLHADEETRDQTKMLFIELDLQYRKSHKWLYRQIYVYLCECLAQVSIDKDTYVSQVIPNLLSLTWDAVPNVRLAVARCLTRILPLAYLPSHGSEHYQVLLQSIFSLQSDIDKDVRHYACMITENSDSPL